MTPEQITEEIIEHLESCGMLIGFSEVAIQGYVREPILEIVKSCG